MDELAVTKVEMQEAINDIIKNLDGNNFDASKVSDGYHTFAELYEFRKLYNALLFNQWARLGKYNVVKSYRHSDGKFCFDSYKEWFIVVAQTPFGQISNHYTSDKWDLFNVESVDKAPEFDGHTTQDVIERMQKTIEAENKIPY